MNQAGTWKNRDSAIFLGLKKSEGLCHIHGLEPECRIFMCPPCNGTPVLKS